MNRNILSIKKSRIRISRLTSRSAAKYVNYSELKKATNNIMQYERFDVCQKRERQGFCISKDSLTEGAYVEILAYTKSL